MADKIFYWFFQLGPFLARELIAAFDRGLNQQKFYIAAFSFGVHLTGYIGEAMIKESNGKKAIDRFSNILLYHA